MKKKIGVKIVSVAVAAMLVFSPLKAEAVGFWGSVFSAGALFGGGFFGGWVGKRITGTTTGAVVGASVCAGVADLISLNARKNREIKRLQLDNERLDSLYTALRQSNARIQTEREGALEVFGVRPEERANANLAHGAEISKNIIEFLQRVNETLQWENENLKQETARVRSSYAKLRMENLTPQNERKNALAALGVAPENIANANLVEVVRGLKSRNAVMERENEDLKRDNEKLKNISSSAIKDLSDLGIKKSALQQENKILKHVKEVLQKKIQTCKKILMTCNRKTKTRNRKSLTCDMTTQPCDRGAPSCKKKEKTR